MNLPTTLKTRPCKIKLVSATALSRLLLLGAAEEQLEAHVLAAAEAGLLGDVRRVDAGRLILANAFLRLMRATWIDEGARVGMELNPDIGEARLERHFDFCYRAMERMCDLWEAHPGLFDREVAVGTRTNFYYDVKYFVTRPIRRRRYPRLIATAFGPRSAV